LGRSTTVLDLSYGSSRGGWGSPLLWSELPMFWYLVLSMNSFPGLSTNLNSSNDVSLMVPYNLNTLKERWSPRYLGQKPTVQDRYVKGRPMDED
jgi:hypothetical protein